MKAVYKNPVRHYRRHAAREDEISFQVLEAESDLWITVLREAGGESLRVPALEAVRQARAAIAGWIRGQPEFGVSLTPVSVPAGAPAIVRHMANAAVIMSVGPMACVAGAVAGAVAGRLASLSPDCLVENGGDAMLYSSKERIVGILSDPGAGVSLGLLLKPEDFPLSLCASSAYIGHSLSLGKGDLAMARAKDPCLADAAATAYCNMLRIPADVRKAAKRAGQEARRLPQHIDGLFVQCGEAVAIWGAMEVTAVAGR